MKLMDFIVDVKMNNAKAISALTDTTKKADALGKSLSSVDKKVGGLGGMFSGIGAKLDPVKSKMAGIAKGAAVAGGALVGAGVSAAVFAQQVASSIDDLGDFAAKNDVAVESVQKFGYAAQLNGAGIEDIKSSIEGLNKVVGESITGVGRGAKMLDKFGLSGVDAAGKAKSFDEMLLEISDKMQGMSNQQAIAMAEKLGIDSNLVPMLLSGREAIKGLTDEAERFGVVTASEAADAGKFADEFDKIAYRADVLKNKIGLALIPVLLSLFDQFSTKFDLHNPEGINNLVQKVEDAVPKIIEFTNNIGTLIGTAAKITKFFADLVGGVDNLVIAVLAFKSLSIAAMFPQIIAGVSAAIPVIKSLSAALWANPILLIIGALAVAAYLIYDNWSIIAPFFINLWNTIVAKFEAAKNLIVGKITSMFNSIKQKFVDAKNFLMSITWSDVANALLAPFVWAEEKIAAVVSSIKSFAGIASNVSVAGASGSTNVTNNVTVNANTSNPQAVGKYAGRGVTQAALGGAG